MAQETILVLNSGGLRSAVAGAWVKSAMPAAMRVFLYVEDGRHNSATRAKRAQEQAEALGGRLIAASLRDLYGQDKAKDLEGMPVARVTVPRLLLTAGAYARAHKIGRVIWGGSYDANMDAAARAAEQLELVDQLMALEDGPSVVFEAPLLEKTDAELVTMGRAMDAPLERSVSCIKNKEGACGVCAGCIRRSNAFTAAREPAGV